MDQISTAGAYSAVLAGLNNAQTQLNTAVAQTSSGMKSSDLQGFAGNAETLTAMQNVQTQVTGYLNNSQNTASVLSTQDAALTQLGTSVTTASSAVSNAVATGNGDGLIASLQAAYESATEALNTQYNGQYLFSGGQVNTPPVSATSLTALAAAPTVASVFQNGQAQTTTQLDGSTTIQTGFLASQLGKPLFNVLQAIQTYSNGPNGPLTGTLTATQSSWLQGQIASLQSAGTGVTDATAQNGVLQDQVTAVQSNLTAQQTSLQTMIGNVADADMAQVATNLQQAQLALQASAQVFQTLKTTSLASLLPIS
jgi:flagellar hook-associated protein 3 FlgL